jgi:hypothetical protein
MLSYTIPQYRVPTFVLQRFPDISTSYYLHAWLIPVNSKHVVRKHLLTATVPRDLATLHCNAYTCAFDIGLLLYRERLALIYIVLILVFPCKYALCCFSALPQTRSRHCVLHAISSRYERSQNATITLPFHFNIQGSSLGEASTEDKLFCVTLSGMWKTKSYNLPAASTW